MGCSSWGRKELGMTERLTLKPVLGFARETEPVEGVCVYIRMCLYAYKD